MEKWFKFRPEGGRLPMFNDEQLERFFPGIPWREPIRYTRLGSVHGRLGCRLCMARYGVSAGENPPYVSFVTREEFDAHMQEQHEVRLS